MNHIMHKKQTIKSVLFCGALKSMIRGFTLAAIGIIVPAAKCDEEVFL
jgi:hypothetical protein